MNVSPCGLVVYSDACHLGASPDGRIVDPTEQPPFGLVEVKCPDVENISEVKHIKLSGGLMKRNHKYYWQIQGQLAVTGLKWCDAVTNTRSDLTVERVWRDDTLIEEMKEKLVFFYFNSYMKILLFRECKCKQHTTKLHSLMSG